VGGQWKVLFLKISIASLCLSGEKKKKKKKKKKEKGERSETWCEGGEKDRRQVTMQNPIRYAEEESERDEEKQR